VRQAGNARSEPYIEASRQHERAAVLDVDVQLKGEKLLVMMLTFGVCSLMNGLFSARHTHDAASTWVYGVPLTVTAAALIWVIMRKGKD